MKEIKELTVVTAQGVGVFSASSDTKIIEGSYEVCGDPYPCFIVEKENIVVAEIRCIHNVILKY